MPATVMLHAGLRRCQADQRLRHELRPGPFLRRTVLNVPRAGRVDAKHRDRRRFDLRDDGREGLAEGASKREAENGVDEEVGRFNGYGEVVDEGHGEVGELGFEALMRFSFPLPLFVL